MIDDLAEATTFNGEGMIAGSNGEIAFTGCTFNGRPVNCGGEGAEVKLFDCACMEYPVYIYGALQDADTVIRYGNNRSAAAADISEDTRT